MAKSDYQILGLNDFASQDEIKKAYKKLALKYHPDKNNEAGAEDRFKEITSAYQSLVNNNKNKNVTFEEMYDTSFSAEYFRRAYQKFSPQDESSYFFRSNADSSYARSNAYEESTSSDSISSCSSDDLINEYLKQRNVFENFCDIAESVFENNNPFYETSNMKDESKESESLCSDDSEKSDEEKSGNGPEISKDFTLNRKHDRVECNLYLSLEELVKGGLKRIAIPNGNKKKKIIKINLKPGNPVGAKIIFPKVCLGKGEPPKDFVIVVCDKPHPHFVRDGSNIHYEANISLKTALCCSKIAIPTLDGEDFVYSPTDVVQPNSQQQFAGKGLPLTVDGKERGNMVVSFKVDFPKKLSMACKKILKVALP